MFGLIILLVFRIVYSDGDLRPELKIIGGDAVRNRTDFAYQVSLRYKGAHFCGGAIIDHTFIVTAAHCCFDNDDKPWKIKNLRIVAGDLNLNYRSNNTIVKNVVRVFVHPKYNSEQILNDIAVWEVYSPFFWSQHVQPIRLANQTIPENSMCNVSGWGVTDYARGTIDAGLQYVQVPIYSHEKCRQIYPEIDYLNAICAGSPGKDSCQGDSGGPLVCNGSLAGIVSYGIKCGIYPGVYTDVYTYRSWIRKKTHRMSSTSKLYNFNNILIASTFVLIINLINI